MENKTPQPPSILCLHICPKNILRFFQLFLVEKIIVGKYLFETCGVPGIVLAQGGVLGMFIYVSMIQT
jgi:hypothetical protein